MKKFLLGTILILILGIAVFISKLNKNNNKPEGMLTTPTSTLVGGDRDMYGCIGSAGYTWCENKKKCLRPWEEQCGTDQDEIKKAVEQFYKSYNDCMYDPPDEAKGKVGEYCQVNTGYSSTGFFANLEKEGTAKAGADPIVCAQNIPEITSTAKIVSIDSDKASATIDEISGKLTVNPQIALVKENNIWKVDNIVCPKN